MRRSWLLLWLVFSFLARVGAQHTINHDIGVVKTEALQHPWSFSYLQELSDHIGPRLTGSPAEAQAGRWALDTMRAIGLQHVHPEPWRLEKGWRRRYARGQLISPFSLELIITSYGWAGSTSRRNMEAELVQVDSDALAEDIRKNSASWTGKVLLFAPNGPKHPDAVADVSQFPAFLSAALAAHAVAIVRRDPRPGNALLHTGPIAFPIQSTSMAVLDIAKEQEDLIVRILHSGTPVRLRLDVLSEFTPDAVLSNNIVGEIPGLIHPEEVVVLGAHLDSWDLGTGSMDDGFGVAAVLGAAKSMIASGIKPQRTIRFVLFTGEEQGLLGSRAYTRAHQHELKNLVCALILDWGNGPITKFPLAGHTELAAPLEELFRSIGDFASIQTANGYLTYTDAYAFTLAGVPAIAPLQDSRDYNLFGHSAADTLDKVSPDVLNRDSVLLALAGMWIANYPTRIGLSWSPEMTAKMLVEQRAALQEMGLWPFPE